MILDPGRHARLALLDGAAARVVWRTKSMVDSSPRGIVHATDDERVTLCGKPLAADGKWWFGGWTATDADAVITCAKCKRHILTHNQ